MDTGKISNVVKDATLFVDAQGKIFKHNTNVYVVNYWGKFLYNAKCEVYQDSIKFTSEYGFQEFTNNNYFDEQFKPYYDKYLNKKGFQILGYLNL